MFKENEIVAGRFKIIQPTGGGGMGLVYKVEADDRYQTALEVTAALSGAADADRIKQEKEQADALARKANEERSNIEAEKAREEQRLQNLEDQQGRTQDLDRFPESEECPECSDRIPPGQAACPSCDYNRAQDTTSPTNTSEMMDQLFGKKFMPEVAAHEAESNNDAPSATAESAAPTSPPTAPTSSPQQNAKKTPQTQPSVTTAANAALTNPP